MTALDVLLADRVLAVVRATAIPDPKALATSLAGSGIRAIELTYTTPDVLGLLAKAAEVPDAVLGMGTVTTAARAHAAIDHGARFLVTPAVRADVAEVAALQDIPVVMGAFTPTEVLAALDLGAAAVKIFPAGALGPRYLKDLLGPFPGAPLVPSGGVDAGNAAEFLANGAVAVCAGTSVVSPDAVAAGSWSDIASRAVSFVRSMN